MRKSAILVIVLYPLLAFAAFPDDIVEHTKSAVVALYIDENLNGFIGSGFFIDSSGSIMTVEHVVRYPILWARLYDGKKFELDKILVDKNKDLAILRPRLSKNEIANFSYLKFGDANNLAVGQLVMAIGNSVGSLWQIVYGNIKNLNEKIAEKGEKSIFTAIKYTPAFSRGFSGSPLVNENGLAIGVNAAYLAEFSYAINLKEIKPFIEEFYEKALP